MTDLKIDYFKDFKALQFYIDQTKEDNRVFYTTDFKDTPIAIDRSLESSIIELIEIFSQCNKNQGLGYFTIIESKKRNILYGANVELVKINHQKQLAMRLLPISNPKGV